MRVIVSNETAKLYAKTLASRVIKALDENKEVMLLVSGGSLQKVYELVPAFFPKRDLTNLAVTVADERWNKNPWHKDSNWQQFKQTEFYHFLRANNAHTITVLQGGEMQKEAENYNTFIAEAIKKNVYFIASLGIGEDAHTAGILPAGEGLFIKTFRNDKYIVAHELFDKFRNRITIAPKFLAVCNEIIVYAEGEEKYSPLKIVLSLDKKYPGPEWEKNLNKYPALLLSGLDTTIYTDQLIV